MFIHFFFSFTFYNTMSNRKAFNKVAASGLKYKPIYTPPPPPPPPKSRPKLGPILIGGSLLYLTATYVSMLVFKSKTDTDNMIAGKGPEDPTVTPKSFDTASVWETVAKKYDQEINWDEIIMGVGLLRRFLISNAKVSNSALLLLTPKSITLQLTRMKNTIGRCFGSLNGYRP